MSYSARRRSQARLPLKQVTRGTGLPMEIVKHLAPLALSMGMPIGEAVGKRIARMISPERKEGNGYRLAGGRGYMSTRSRSRSRSKSKSRGRGYMSTRSRSRSRSSSKSKSKSKGGRYVYTRSRSGSRSGSRRRSRSRSSYKKR